MKQTLREKFEERMIPEPNAEGKLTRALATIDRLRREKVAFINGDVGRCMESKYFGQWLAMNADRPFATAQAALDHLCGPEYAHDCPVCLMPCVCAEVPDGEPCRHHESVGCERAP